MEVLACAIMAFTYLATLSFGFVYDDNITILQNPRIHTFREVINSLTVADHQSLYRPLTGIWFFINYFLFSSNAACWHAMTLALHILITYLVFRVTYELLGDRTTAFVASLLFGVHPAHVENVAWVSAVNDLLMSAFVLASFLAFVQYRKQGSRRFIWFGFSLVFFSAALLSKETAAVFPALILMFSWLFTESGENLRMRVTRSIGTSTAYFGVLLVYLFARSFAVRGAISSKAASLSWTTMLLTWPSVLWFDVKHLVWPVSLSEFYLAEYVEHPGLMQFVLPIVLLVALSAIVLFWIRQLRDGNDARVALFACAWILLPLLPTLYIRALTPKDFLHDRFLYLPSVGFVILIALAIRNSGRALSESRRSAMQMGAVALLAVACVVCTFSNLMPWASDVLLYQNGLKFIPNSSNLKDNFANALDSRGQTQQAILLYQEVLEREPSFWRSNYNLGHAYLKVSRFPEAEASLTRAIQIDNSDSDQFIYLAVAQWRQNKLDDALRNGEHALQLSPRSQGYHYILGGILRARGDNDRAISEFKRELIEHPENTAARYNIQKLQLLN